MLAGIDHIPDGLAICLRLARAGWATLGELATSVTFDDAVLAIDMLDALDDAEFEARKRAEKKR